MMPTFFGTNMAGGVPSHPVSNGAYAVDTMLNELTKQLMGHTRRHSRASNGQARPGTAMRISKPGSANNSPRTSTMQSRRRTMIGDGFQCKLQTRSPAMMDQPYLPTPASETSGEVFHERRGTRPARPLSWHPSSQLPQYHHQQPLFPGPEDNSSAMLCPFPAYNEIDMLEALQHGPPTPAAYSGYASPADAFSPLLLPYPCFGAQSICSPPQQQQQQQRQGMVFSPAVPHNYPSAHPESLEAPYLPPALPALPSPAPAQDAFDWASYPASGSTATTALLTQHTAPPTPEDFSCSLAANTRQQQHQQQQQQQATEYNTNINSTQQEQQQPPTSSYQPLIIRDDDANTEDDEPEGEILYGMGLYDAPNPNKADLHRSAVFSLLGGCRAPEEETVPGAGRQGLGLKLEDAWEPPASDDEDEDEDQEDGEGDDDEEDDDE